MEVLELNLYLHFTHSYFSEDHRPNTGYIFYTNKINIFSSELLHNYTRKHKHINASSTFYPSGGGGVLSTCRLDHLPSLNFTNISEFEKKLH
jgi:hypothetical protein